MNILIMLVVAIFIITGAYVGYHASQQTGEDSKGHGIPTETLGTDASTVLVLQNTEPAKYAALQILDLY